MKYRLIIEPDEITVIVEDGGIACVRKAEPIDGEPRVSVTDYYHTRLTSLNTCENLYEQLAEGDMSCTDWATDTFNSNVTLQDALAWLCVGNTCWERDDSIFQEFTF